MPPINTINLHPKTHPISSLESHSYDVICIGSGWAGRVLAARVCKAGMTALIIENELVGGDCPFWACVPSKALLRPGEALEAARSVGGTREVLASSKVDVEAVWKRRDAFTEGWDDTQLLVPMVEKSGAKLVRGTGTVIGVKRVKVESFDGESVELDARHAVAVCTGSEVVFPDVPGLKEAKPWTPREATSSSTLPRHLIVMGAGAVGSEMATAYASFGAKVTVITNTKEILPRLPSQAAKIVRENLSSRGVSFHLATKVTAVKRTKEGTIEATLENGETVSGDELLVATGRRARTEGIGLETVGLRIDRTPIAVDESLCVESVPGNWLYAVGDVNGRSPLTHMCKYQGRIAGEAIVARANGRLDEGQKNVPWGRFSATADREAIPQVVFTDPIVASVGLTSSQAKENSGPVREIEAALTTVGSLLHGDEQHGWAQWLLDEKSRKLVGATYVGRDVEDLLHASTVAIVGGITVDRLAHAVPSFPTMTEVYLNLIDAVGV